MVKVSLTEKQAKKLSEVLWESQDEGPWGKGWASDELAELRNIVDNAIKAEDGNS